MLKSKKIPVVNIRKGYNKTPMKSIKKGRWIYTRIYNGSNRKQRKSQEVIYNNKIMKTTSQWKISHSLIKKIKGLRFLL